MYIVLADHDAISGVPIHNFVQVTCRYSGLVRVWDVGTFESTGGSNKKGTRTEDVLKNTVYVELYDVDVHD